MYAANNCILSLPYSSTPVIRNIYILSPRQLNMFPMSLTKSLLFTLSYCGHVVMCYIAR